MEGEYTQIAINLLGVLIVLLLALYILKKFRASRYQKNKLIKILNIVPIGSKEKIILMNVNNTTLLVGATPNHIETLFVFNEFESEKMLSTDKEEPKLSFAEQINNIEK